MIKLLTILGTRPQFIKSSSLSRSIDNNPYFNEITVHTGQHYDSQMSAVFFSQLSLRLPKYQLKNHTSIDKVIRDIQAIIQSEAPHFVIVYGDTNATLAGAIAANNTNTTLVHIEAGLRSFNYDMQEETNRIITDKLSDILFCPTSTSKNHLKKEILKPNAIIKNCGDVMLENVLHFVNHSLKPSLKYTLPKTFIFFTLHRAENTNNKAKLNSIIHAINTLAEQITIIFAIHPRTQKAIKKHRLSLHKNIMTINPQGYLESLWLIKHCECILSDSGGIQKEAFFLKKHCLVLRNETEWKELEEIGAVVICGTNSISIVEKTKHILTHQKNNHLFSSTNFYGQGNSSHIILQELSSNLQNSE